MVKYFFHRIHRFHRIFYVIFFLPQNLMRLIFVRNAVNFVVNFCKKCGEIFIFTAFTGITACLTKIHRISYKILPKNLDPGITIWLLLKVLGYRRYDVPSNTSLLFFVVAGDNKFCFFYYFLKNCLGTFFYIKLKFDSMSLISFA